MYVPHTHTIVLFGDAKIASEILVSKDPKEHKTLGRKVSNFDQTTWEGKCKEIVKKGNGAKVVYFSTVLYHTFCTLPIGFDSMSTFLFSHSIFQSIVESTGMPVGYIISADIVKAQ